MEKEEEQEQEQESIQQTRNSNPSLEQVIYTLQTLITLSHSVKVFAVKWQLIRAKLEELHAGLIAAENTENSSSFDTKTSLARLIRSIMAAVGECSDLARRCVELTYSGKLLMQSDLDIMFTKLDCHVKKLGDVYSLGILCPNHAIVVSKPGLGACRDDMRFYVRDLLTRLKIGEFVMKKQALVNLRQVITEDTNYVKIIALEVIEIVSVLVSLMEVGENEIQDEAVMVVLAIAGFESFKGVLVGAGVIGPLVRVLECGSEVGKEGAARCLMKLTGNADNAWSVSAQGGVTALLKICCGGGGGGVESDVKAELVGPACKVLRNLVGIEEIKQFMVDEGAVSIFLKLMQSKDENVQIYSIEFLQAIGLEDESVRQMFIREGGICSLVHILEPTSQLSSKTREIALRGAENLCFPSTNGINMLVNYGFLELLLHFLQNGEGSMQELALKVSAKLCATSEEAKRALGDAGFMSEFVKFLDAKSFEVREMAAEALSSMVLVPKNRKRFVQEERNIGFLMRLLDPAEGNSGYKKFLLSTLMAITSCNSGRRKIVNSGYVRNIEKLAEAEVSDAKQLVRKLSSNRFRIMLSGIWRS